MTPQELKNSILQLAIQGRLVEQRSEEGTAEELYQQIQREKAALVKAGKIKKEKPLPEITEEEMPFEIPEGWKWVRWGSVINVVSARRVHQVDWRGEGIPFYRAREIAKLADNGYVDNELYITKALYDEFSKSGVPHAGDLMVTAVGTLGKVYIVQEGDRFYYKDASVICLENYGSIDPRYLRIVMQSDMMMNQIRSNSSGTTVATLTMVRMIEYLLPLPPLAEQKRIVEKIEELLPYIDRYEVAWSHLEDFNKRFPMDMQKSILQLAIQGKLGPQRPEEGTGEALYQQIRAEKQSLIRSGKLKKEKPLPEITPDEIPFDIPESWKWVHLNDVSFTIGDIDHKMPEKISGKGIPYISPLDFTPQGIDYDRAKQISLEDYELLGKKIKPEQDDIIFPRYGTIGVVRMVDTDRPFLVSYSCCTIKNMLRYMYPKYIFYVLKSPMIQDEINKYINKTTQPNVGLASIKRFLFPLPSLAEQKRIVAKLEELLPLCERLK